MAATQGSTYVVAKFRKRLEVEKRRRSDLDSVRTRSRDTDDVLVDARWPQARFQLQLLNAYWGKPYAGGAVLFRTVLEPASFDFDLGTTNGWTEAIVRGGVHVEELQCGHLDITEEPYVGEVAKRLASHLLRSRMRLIAEIRGRAARQKVAGDLG